jgi:chromate transporter
MKELLSLIFTFFKIGLFTFGGGYAMIAQIRESIVENKKWLSHDEFLEIVAIAESTPGPIAINSSTYIGYKVSKFWGSFFSTIAVALPSFVIIYLISLFFDAFLTAEYVGYAFKGIQVGVIYLITTAGLNMFKKMKKSAFNIIIFAAAMVLLIANTLFAVKVSSILFILAGALIGIFAYLIKKANKKEGKQK